MEKKILLQAKGISKRFPGVLALDNISFDIYAGEVHILLGENGAGKSTLMKVLTGVYSLDEGQIILEGTPVHFKNAKDAQDHNVTIIHQEFNLMPHLNVAENIFIGREPQTVRGVIDYKALHAKAATLLKRLNASSIDTYSTVSDLSVAAQQMVEIAKAISFDSKVLIMDEPTAALTEQETEKLFDVIDELRASGMGIVYISHRMNELKRLADRVTVFRDGTLIKTLMFKDTTIDDLITMMVGRELTNAFPPKESKIGKVCLKVSGLGRKNYFEDINFDLRSGEIIGVSGLMGAGRTSLGRSLCGADGYDTGSIEVDGVPVTIHNVADGLKMGIAYLSEDRKREGLFMGQSIEDNIIVPNYKIASKFGVVDFKKSLEIALNYIKKVQVKTPSHKQDIRFLSGGNQQKAIIARWICRPKVVLIIDEPTRGIDVNAKYEIYKLLFELGASGAGIIMISSELPEILGISDRIMVMHEGRMTALIDNTKDVDSATIMKYATAQENMFPKGA